MGTRIRLLRTGAGTAYFNMGLDEAILESVSRGASLPTLRTYSWSPRAITLGYFQGIEEEVDRAACEAAGVDLTRRITGGGAVFHDDEVTYSIILPEGLDISPPSIIDSYRLICSGIVAGLRNMGIEARFAPINDIVAGEKKISGNAQTRKKGCLLQHGTLLLSVDPKRMFSLLRVPKEKSIGRLAEEIEARVSSASRILGRTVGFGEAEEALIRGFSQALDLELIPGEPAAAELECAEELARDKFDSEAWKGRR